MWPCQGWQVWRRHRMAHFIFLCVSSSFSIWAHISPSELFFLNLSPYFFIRALLSLPELLFLHPSSSSELFFLHPSSYFSTRALLHQSSSFSIRALLSPSELFSTSANLSLIKQDIRCPIVSLKAPTYSLPLKLTQQPNICLLVSLGAFPLFAQSTWAAWSPVSVGVGVGGGGACKVTFSLSDSFDVTNGNCLVIWLWWCSLNGMLVIILSQAESPI